MNLFSLLCFAAFRYNTFARTVPAETDIVKAFIALCREHSWKKFTIIYEEHPAHEELYQALRVSAISLSLRNVIF